MRLLDPHCPRQFGKEALTAIQNLARQNSPQGFRVLLRAGEYGCQLDAEPLSFEILGGEIIRPEIRNLYDPSKELTPSEVDKKPDADCVFDKIVNGQIPVPPLFKEAQVFVFKPNQMLAKEHLLFIPTQHYRDILGVTDPDFFGSVFAKITEFAQEEEFSGGFMLVSNNGPWGGQAVQHLYFHMRGGEKFESPFWQDWQTESAYNVKKRAQCMR